MRPPTYVCLASCLFIMSASARASAQQWLIGAGAEIASGVAGGGVGGGALERARTRVKLGADLRVDEFPKDVFGIAVVAELEPHSSVGLDLRYMRTVAPRLEVNAGAIGFVFPESLVGPTCGLRYRLRVSRLLEVTMGPEIDVFVVGTDLPGGSIIWQALAQAGVHFEL